MYDGQITREECQLELSDNVMWLSPASNFDAFSLATTVALICPVAQRIFSIPQDLFALRIDSLDYLE